MTHPNLYKKGSAMAANDTRNMVSDKPFYISVAKPPLKQIHIPKRSCIAITSSDAPEVTSLEEECIFKNMHRDELVVFNIRK